MNSSWPVVQQTPWVDGAPIIKAPTLDELLVQWDIAKQRLDAAKAAEMDLRKQCFALGFGANAQDGTNTLELGNGYELKGVKKLNYKLVAPVDYKGTVIDAVDDCVSRMCQISNEGSFIADRIFKYSVDLSKTEYNALEIDATTDETKRKLLAEVNKVIEINEGAPTLTIKEPKGKK